MRRGARIIGRGLAGVVATLTGIAWLMNVLASHAEEPLGSSIGRSLRPDRPESAPASSGEDRARSRYPSLGALRRRHLLTRKRLAVLAVVLVALTVVGGLIAYFFAGSTTGSYGAAKAGTVGAPSGVTVPSYSNTGTVHLSWTGSTLSNGGPVDGYYVTRFLGSTPSPACGTSLGSPTTLLSCDDTSVPEGSFTYVVSAVYHEWFQDSSSSSAVTVDTTPPAVSGVSSTLANGSYKAGQVVPVTVSFSESVTVTGTPQLTLETGATDETVNYTSGSGSSTLTFSYTVQAGDTSADLDYVATNSLTLNGGTIRDAALNDADRTLASPGAAGSLAANKAIVIDTTPPTVTNVSSTLANGSYKAGQLVPVTVTFSESVSVTGTPQLLLETGATDRTVNYASGSGTSTLTFSYTVQAGDTSADLDYVGTGSLTLNAGTIQDAATNAATLTLPTPGAAGSLAANKAIVIDTTAPTLSSINRAGASSSVNSGPLTWTVTFSEPVNGVTTSNFTLATSGTGGTAPTITSATATGGAPSATWTVSVSTTGTTGTNAGSIGLNLANNTGVQDVATNNLSTSTFTGQAYTYDTTAPTVTGVSSTLANGAYKAGQLVPVTVTFSEPVTVTGTPQLTLETGATDRTVNYASGSGTSTLTFNYTVQAGDTSADLDYVATSSLTLNAGTIQDAATNDANRTLASPGAAGSLGANKAIVIDTTPPAVSGVSSTLANGSYKAGQVVPVTVSFSEPVTVTGTPQLTLETGATDETVNYTSGSGSSTLTFSYTVQAGDTSADLDYVATNSLTLNGGTIRDAALNDADRTLASPGAAGSLAANKAIVIDTTPPTVTNVSSTLANGSYKAGQLVPVTVTFSESVSVTGTPQLLLETGATDRTVNYASGSGTSTLTFSYTVQAGDTSADLDYVGTGSLTLNAGTIQDAATNAATLTLPTPGAAGSLAANKAIVIDTTAPTLSSINRAGASSSVNSGPLTWTVTFSEPVNGVTTSNFTLATSGTGGTAPTITSATATGGAPSATWTVSVSTTGTTGTNAGSIGLNLANNTGVQDVATNNLSTSTFTGQAYTYDTTAPTVTGVSSTLANGAYKAGQLVPVTVTFSEPVTVTGTPQLTLETGATDRTVNYASGSGTSTLTFNYTVQAGDTSADLDYVATSSLTLNAGTIQDAATNDANRTLASPGAAGSLGANKAIVIDTTAPTTASFIFPVNGASYPNSTWTSLGRGSWSGSAADNAGGSGIASVQISARRSSDGMCIKQSNGKWQTSCATVDDGLFGVGSSTSWSYSGIDPPGAGTTITAEVKVTDNAGNSTTTVITFTVT